MIIVNIAILLFVLGFLYFLQRKFVSFNKRVFAGFLLGGIVGLFVHYQDQSVIDYTVNIYNIIGVGYVRFLQMLVYPILSVAILHAFTKIGDDKNVEKAISIIIFVLLITTSISALVGIAVTLGFNLRLDSLVNITPNSGAIVAIQEKASLLDKPFYTIFTDFIPTNPFYDLTGMRANSIASLVIFFVCLGVAYLGIARKEPEIGKKFKNGIDILFKIVMRLVILILRLTPYGVFALFFKILATSNLNEILGLAEFLVVSYVAIIIMFVIHLLLLMLFGINVTIYIKKIIPLLVFAFTSRSSSASIPINISTQTNQLGVPDSIAAAGSSFGSMLGQNGCAGIYPSILAVVIAPSVGIDPTSISFILMLVAIITVTSFGIAGVGGGATFAAISVLGAFNMPLTLVAILIAIEPLIDMARTALNVNGSVLASVISAKITKGFDKKIFEDMETIKNDDTVEI